MNTKHIVGCAITIGCLLGGISAHATLSLGSERVVKGTKIEVLGPGLDLQALINGITDEAANKPYLIELGPGEYTLNSSLAMKPFVSIAGSGQGVTILKGAVGNGVNEGSAIVRGASNAALTDLSIENTGNGTLAIGIYNSNASPRIERVTVSASGGSSVNNGVFNFTSSPVMNEVTAAASGGAQSRGVFNSSSSSPIMTSMAATASGGTTSNAGVLNTSSSSPAMTNVFATASGGAESSGVRNEGSSPTMTNVAATAFSGTTINIGVNNLSSSAPIMGGVTATASGGSNSNGVRNDQSSPNMQSVTANAFNATGNVGVYNRNNSAPTMTTLTAAGTGGSTSYGVFNEDNTVFIKIHFGVMTGTTAALRFSGNSATRVANSVVNGSVLNDPMGDNCGGVYDADLGLVNC